MAGFLLKRLDSLAGLACESAYENAVYRERFMALRRQLPWLYATLCINVVSIYVVAADDLASVMAPVAAITAVVAFRFVHLLRTDPARLSDARIRQELRNIFIVASVCFAANAIWMCVLFAHLDGTRRGEMAVLGGLAAIGASSGLSWGIFFRLTWLTAALSKAAIDLPRPARSRRRFARSSQSLLR